MVVDCLFLTRWVHLYRTLSTNLFDNDQHFYITLFKSFCNYPETENLTMAAYYSKSVSQIKRYDGMLVFQLCPYMTDIFCTLDAFV